MKLNLSSGHQVPDGGYKVVHGGVSDLNAITLDMEGVPNGIAISNQDNKIEAGWIVPDSLGYVPMLQGPLQLTLGETGEYHITNFHYHLSYDSSTNDGTIFVTHDRVFFTPSVMGDVTFVVKDRIFPVEVVGAYVVAPVITGPTQISSSSLTLFASAFETKYGSDSYKDTDWEISKNSSFIPLVDYAYADPTKQTSWNITGLEPNTTYYIRVRHRGQTLGESRWSVFHRVTPAGVAKVAKPSITEPSHNSSGIVIPTVIRSSSFNPVFWQDSHIESQWHVSFDGNFNNPLLDIASVQDLISILTSEIPYNTILYTRVRHKGIALDWSEWSDPSMFRTIQPSINRPTIVEPVNGAVDLPVSVMLRSSSFNATGGLVHQTSSWQLSLSSNFSTIEKFSTNSSTDLTTWTVNDLKFDTTYFARVRHYGNLSSASEWSPVISFKTKKDQYYMNILGGRRMGKEIYPVGTFGSDHILDVTFLGIIDTAPVDGLE